MIFLELKLHFGLAASAERVNANEARKTKAMICGIRGIRGIADAIGLTAPIAVTKSGGEGGGSEKCVRNGFEKSYAGPWDFHVTAEKAMQWRTWRER
ncbi:MAG: hypothetical protein WBF06_00715 [Candidatus Acidiferrales bacterium]